MLMPFGLKHHTSPLYFTIQAIREFAKTPNLQAKEWFELATT